MAQRTNADMGLVDGLTSDLGGPRTAALLHRLDAAIPWNALVRPIEALPEYRAVDAFAPKDGADFTGLGARIGLADNALSVLRVEASARGARRHLGIRIRAPGGKQLACGVVRSLAEVLLPCTLNSGAETVSFMLAHRGGSP